MSAAVARSPAVALVFTSALWFACGEGPVEAPGPDSMPPMDDESPCSLGDDGHPRWLNTASAAQFVRVERSGDTPHFAVGECRFRFVLLNAYYLQEEAVRGGTSARTNVDETLDKIYGLGVTVVRTWGFNDEPGKDTAMQRAPLEYDEANLVGLDRVIAEARARGLRLIIPLVNYWDAYGGVRQYVAWRGLSAPREGDPRFFTDAAIRDHFRTHITNLVQRVNTVTGVVYRDDPTIAAWELGNELRGAGLDGEGRAMRAWVDEMAGALRAVDPNHLIATGEEGLDTSFEGYDRNFWPNVGDWMFQAQSSFRANVASPHIDFGTVHLFPEAWGWNLAHLREASQRWFSEHADIARAQGKPLIVEELGLTNGEVIGGGAFDLAARREHYRAWFQAGLDVRVGALGLWMFSYDARPDRWDNYTFFWKTGTALDAPENRYADIVRQYSRLYLEP